MYKFTIKAGHQVFLGSLALTVLADQEFGADVASPDEFAEKLFAHGGQRLFGEHVGALTHDEVVTRNIEGKLYDVVVKVSYGAGGARVVVDNEEYKPRLHVADKPVPSPPSVLTEVEQPPSTPPAPTEFSVPVGRFPAEIQTATDVGFHPVTGEPLTPAEAEAESPVAEQLPVVEQPPSAPVEQLTEANMPSTPSGGGGMSTAGLDSGPTTPEVK